ncbi:MAG: CBS domain-containing protein [Hadesarchaea archaeon]|nr:CBS domain-containing protein [Hadesarchaea archaeon]
MGRSVPVREAMTAKVLTVGPKATVARAAKLMSQNGVGSLVVVERGKPVGILTERDLLMKVVSENIRPSEIRVEEIMSRPVITTTPDEDIIEATRTLIRNKIRRLPVVENGKLVGIITASDITAVSPELMEVLPEHHEIQSEEEIEESVCEVCGEVTRSLKEINGMLVCEKCYDFLTG